MKAPTLFNNLLADHKKTKSYPTLSARSSFSVLTKGDLLGITNSKNNSRLINVAEFEIVFARYEELKKKNLQQKASYYTDSHWKKKGCPSRIFSPYVAKLIDCQKNKV